MNQEKLEEKVREIFERQGFEVEKTDQSFHAVKEDEEKHLQVFSSRQYSKDEVLEEIEEGSIVFVDEQLEDIADETDEQVSVIREEDEEPDFDLPSYELIGDIAVINDLAGRDEDESVEGILHHHPFVKTVLLKEEPLTGEFRVGEYKKLYGEETETVHKEFGLEYKVDPTKVYFSERFGTERKRVVDQIEDGERVLVIGAGVGPFAILAADRKDVDVVGVEKNPVATEYFRENVKSNNLRSQVNVINADFISYDQELVEFDRVIIPIPNSSLKFLEKSLDLLSSNGGMIHIYSFVNKEDTEDCKSTIENLLNKSNIDHNTLGQQYSGDRSPSQQRYRIDVEVY